MDVDPWVNHLLQSCLESDRKRLIDNLVSLFETDINEDKPVQYTILENLLGQLNRGCNHHFTNDIKMVSKMYRQKLGRNSYGLCKQLFGLCSNITCDNLKSSPKLQPGLNWNVFDEACASYEGHLVIDCSDDARITRCVQPFKDASGEIQLLGEEWNPDCQYWGNNGKKIHRASTESDGMHEVSSVDLDDFSVLDNYVKSLVDDDCLSKSAYP